MWMMVEGETLQIKFSWDTPSIRFTIKPKKSLFIKQWA